jgi:hypothetical protein
MAKMTQPTAVSLARSAARAVMACTFMDPPHPSARWRRRFPVLLQKPWPERETRDRPGRCPCRPKANPRKRRGP